MFFRHLKNILSRQDNSKKNLRCLEDVLRRLGKKSLMENFIFCAVCVSQLLTVKEHMPLKDAKISIKSNHYLVKSLNC